MKNFIFMMLAGAVCLGEINAEKINLETMNEIADDLAFQAQFIADQSQDLADKLWTIAAGLTPKFKKNKAPGFKSDLLAIKGKATIEGKAPLAIEGRAPLAIEGRAPLAISHQRIAFGAREIGLLKDKAKTLCGDRFSDVLNEFLEYISQAKEPDIFHIEAIVRTFWEDVDLQVCSKLLECAVNIANSKI